MATVFTKEQIKELNPQRDPIQLVDEITEYVPGEYIVGKFYVDPNMPVLAGHFPGNPILPGVYTVEACAQVSTIMHYMMPQYKGKTPLFLGINNARFYRPVKPGDTLEFHSKLTNHREEKAILVNSVEVFVNGELTATAEVAVAMR